MVAGCINYTTVDAWKRKNLPITSGRSRCRRSNEDESRERVGENLSFLSEKFVSLAGKWMTRLAFLGSIINLLDNWTRIKIPSFRSL